MTAPRVQDTHQAAELAARVSYGRLVAYLAMRWRDVAAAEDALGDAFVAALSTWPRDGVPARPEAWLLTTARRRLLDAGRHATVETLALPALSTMANATEATGATAFPDERLKLLFVCAHPAIDEAMRTPLMLQTVLGFDAARIAAAFVVAAPTMGQRLARVKTKIRDAGIRFEVPEAHELPLRLGSVLDAIYAAYGNSWEDVAGADTRREGLAEEAIWVGRLVVRLMPAEPETHGLLALMLHCEARRAARRDAVGGYVPLSQQDTTRWSSPMIEEAERILLAASKASAPGRFQLEAAIQSVHAARAETGRTDWDAVALLYEGLLRCAPTIGAHVGHAAAIAETLGAAAGSAALDTMSSDAVASYQPYWALRAHLSRALGRANQARDEYAQAIGLTEDAAAREFLVAQAAAVRRGAPNDVRLPCDLRERQ